MKKNSIHNSVTLIDTSVWVKILRGSSDDLLVTDVQSLLQTGKAAWCPMVRLELWAGVGNARERKQLLDLDDVIHGLEIDESIWGKAAKLADLARSQGMTTPSADILIFACARFHGVKLCHRDKHFDLLARL